MSILKKLTGLLSFTVIVTASASARASDQTPKTSLIDLALDGNRLVNAAMNGGAPSGRESSSSESNPTAAPAQPPPLVDLLPRASLVARDWRGSLKVAGRTMLIDDLRPAASHRMVIARVASDARLSPYAQIGAGEWRVDPILFPQMPTRQAYAGSVGAGLELRTSTGLQIAGEAGYTIFYREGPKDPIDERDPHVLTVLFAAQTTW